LRSVVALPHVASGKVREIFAIDHDHLLFVATDRISAYDAILTPDIPDKGRVLTGISVYFFDLLDTPNHLVSTDIGAIPGVSRREFTDLVGRSMIVRRADVLPMECVVRGFLYGSAWREYAAGGGPTTEHLPAGLEMASELDEPIFTPATKAASGHDLNLTEAAARDLVGDDRYEQLRHRSIDIYQRAAAHAAAGGMILADTKFEFGLVEEQLILVDEVLTPDSSRYWAANRYTTGKPLPSFDKQYVRDWLDSTGWDYEPPAPTLTDGVVAGTRARYVDAFQRITGNDFETYLEECRP
jgi:phosphoribosylaminoimidazole-succinocarboxamide synthase